jgi:hypothetical protein
MGRDERCGLGTARRTEKDKVKNPGAKPAPGAPGSKANKKKVKLNPAPLKAKGAAPGVMDETDCSR